MLGPKRILFTGQSGIKSYEVIRDFVESYHLFNEPNRPLCISVKDRMFDIYCREKGIDTKLNPNQWVDLLKEPISLIVRISNSAFEEIVNEVQDVNRDVFLVCNACFYHLQTLEFIALPSLKHLAKFAPTQIITLIDDIYDIHLRLRQPKQLLVGNKDVVDVMIFDLLKILDWRINEISLSRYFSTQLEIPKGYFVFAIKHLKTTLYNLIYNREKATLYLSHPISKPRRLLDTNRGDLAYPIINEIREMSNFLSERYVCFLPTTIDELRLVDDKEAKGERAFQYGLKERWEKESYENTNSNILFKIPENKSNPKRIYFGHPAESKIHVQNLLDVLFRAIDRQVSIRDKKLVEQSDILFIYRPGYLANLSKGVRLELKYYQLLNRIQGDRINCFIYYPLKDQEDLKARIAEEEFNSKSVGPYLKLQEDDIRNILSTWENVDNLADNIEELMLKYNRQPKIDIGTLNEDVYGERRDFFILTSNTIRENFVKSINHYKNQCDVFIEKNDLRPHEIFHEIDIQLKATYKDGK